MEASSVFIPSCETSGYFSSRQCQQGGQCWCVDPTGREIPGTRQYGDSLVCSEYPGTVCFIFTHRLLPPFKLFSLLSSLFMSFNVSASFTSLYSVFFFPFPIILSFPSFLFYSCPSSSEFILSDVFLSYLKSYFFCSSLQLFSFISFPPLMMFSINISFSS